MKSLAKFWIFILLLTAGVAGYYFYQWQQKHKAVDQISKTSAALLYDAELIGRPAMDFNLIDLKQQSYSLNTWQGQVRLINFWASWCAPCLKEIPDFIAIRNRYHEQGFEVIGIALDQAPNIADFVDKLEINYPILYEDGAVIMQLLTAYGNQMGTLPYSVFIDREGIIRHIHAQGILTAGELEKIVAMLL